jgi:hypothetical protein
VHAEVLGDDDQLLQVLPLLVRVDAIPEPGPQPGPETDTPKE